jgi:hypothetical protein
MSATVTEKPGETKVCSTPTGRARGQHIQSTHGRHSRASGPSVRACRFCGSHISAQCLHAQVTGEQFCKKQARHCTTPNISQVSRQPTYSTYICFERERLRTTTVQCLVVGG